MIIEKMREARREESLAVAREVLATMGESAKQELLTYLAAVDFDFALGRARNFSHLTEVIGSTSKDLEALGIELPQVPKLITPLAPKRNLLTVQPETPSLKELELWLARYFKDLEARKKVVSLFWGERPAYARKKESFIDVAHRISDMTNTTKAEVEGLILISKNPNDLQLICTKVATKNNLHHAGGSHDKVRRNKASRGIGEFTDKTKTEIIYLKDFRSTKSLEQPVKQEIIDEAHPIKDDSTELLERYRNWSRQQLEDYTESEFAYCVFSLFQREETLVSLAINNGSSLSIPSNIQQKLDLIQSLCEVYGFYSYAPRIESAVRAFTQYYLPRYGQSY